MQDSFKYRHIYRQLPDASKRSIVLLTGARQTGKTTISQHRYPQLPYYNFDAIEIRDKVNLISSMQWAQTLGAAIIDEVQKSPQVLEKIKYAFDAQELNFSVLLGSSQILLLRNISESLAGRVSIYELFPLTLSEVYAKPNRALQVPLLDEILHAEDIANCLQHVPSVLLGKQEAEKKQAQTYMLAWGGMPALLHLPEEERQKWLRDYEYTYLERDLADLARLSDLQPFRTFQKLTAMRSAQLLNYSQIARDAGVSADTARRYIEYLKISYQVFLLPPYYQNASSHLIKTPKIYWIDIGILRQLMGFYGQLSGAIFECMVVTEIYKWIKTRQSAAECYFYRTHSGTELDLLIKTQHGLIGVEIKYRDKIYPKDTRAMKVIAKELDQPWLGGLVIYNGDVLEKIAEPNIWAMPAWRLLT
jgi:predicted AAA+ superfamily ATPase